MIPITIKHQNKSVNYEVLVDSGADVCIFDAEIGEVLGIDLKSGRPHKVSGVAGQSATYYAHTVQMEVGGWPYTIEAGFLEKVAGQFHYGVIGQIGFFDRFVVIFNYSKEEIELRPRS